MTLRAASSELFRVVAGYRAVRWMFDNDILAGYSRAGYLRLVMPNHVPMDNIPSNLALVEASGV